MCDGLEGIKTERATDLGTVSYLKYTEFQRVS
jgi:hypothetical protein